MSKEEADKVRNGIVRIPWNKDERELEMVQREHFNMRVRCLLAVRTGMTKKTPKLMLDQIVRRNKLQGAGKLPEFFTIPHTEEDGTTRDCKRIGWFPDTIQLRDLQTRRNKGPPASNLYNGIVKARIRLVKNDDLKPKSKGDADKKVVKSKK